MSASTAERAKTCAADETGANILPHKLLGLPPRKSRVRESRRVGGKNTVEEGLDDVKDARGQTTNLRSEKDAKEATRRNENNPHHKNAQPKTLEEILSAQSGAGRNRAQLHQQHQSATAHVRVDDLLLAIGVSSPPAFDGSDSECEQIDRDEDGDAIDTRNHHDLASSSSRRPSAATAEGDGSSATSSRSTTPGAMTEHQRHHYQRTAVMPLNAEAIWQLRRESESVNIVSGAKRNHQGSAPQGARKDPRKRELGIIDSFNKGKGSAFLSLSQPQSSSGSFLAATSPTHSKPAEGAPPASWRCDKCHYHLLAMDGKGNPLPFGKDAWGRPIPMACPRCLEKHLEWSPTPVFDSYGDHANIIAKLSDVIRYGAPRVIPPSESVFNLFLRRGAAASATTFGRGLMATTTTAEVNTAFATRGRGGGAAGAAIHQIDANSTTTVALLSGEDTDESLFSDSQQLRSVLGISAITRVLPETGDDHSSSPAEKGSSEALGTSLSPTPLQLAKTLPLPFTSVRDARVYQLTLGRPHPISARYFEKDSLVAAKRALLRGGLGGDGITKSDKNGIDRDEEGGGEEEEEEEADDFEVLGDIEDRGDVSAAYTRENGGQRKKKKKPRARHSIYAPLPGPLQGLANLTRVSDGEGGSYIVHHHQHPMSTIRTSNTSSSSSGARLRMLYYNAFRAKEEEKGKEGANGAALEGAVDYDTTATGLTPSPPLRSTHNTGGFVPQPPTPQKQQQQQRSVFVSSTSSQELGRAGGENSFFVGATFSSGLGVPPPMILAQAPAAYLARQGGPSPFSPTTSLFQPRPSQAENGAKPVGGLLGTLLELELDQPLQMPLGSETSSKSAANRTQSVPTSNHTSIHTTPATVPSQKGTPRSGGNSSGRRGVVSVGEPPVVIVKPSSARTCCADDENPMDDLSEKLNNADVDHLEEDTIGDEKTKKEGQENYENTNTALREPTTSTSNSTSTRASSSSHDSRASTLSSNAGGRRNVNATAIPSPPPAAPMAGSAARGSILANSTAELLNQNAAQRQQHSSSSKGPRKGQSSSAAAAAGITDCGGIRDIKGKSNTRAPYYKGLATLASERMMMDDPLGLGLSDPSSLSAPTVEAAELERLRGRKWTFQCARCGRRLHRMDPFGFLIPLGKDREGNVIPLKCAGCGEGSEAHTDFIVVPLARVVQMEEAEEKEKADKSKPRHAPPLSSTPSTRGNYHTSPLHSADKALKGRAVTTGTDRGGASIIVENGGLDNWPKAIARPAVKRIGGGAGGGAVRVDEEKNELPIPAIWKEAEEEEHPTARNKEGLDKNHDFNSDSGGLRNPTRVGNLTQQRKQTEGEEEEGRERRRFVPVIAVSDSFSALSPSQSLPEERRMTLLTPDSTHYSSRNNSPRPSLSSVPLNSLLDAAHKGNMAKDAMMAVGGANGVRASESSSPNMQGVDGFSAPRTSPSRVRVSIISDPLRDTTLRGKIKIGGVDVSSSMDATTARGILGVTSQTSYAKAMALARLLEEK